MEDDDICSNHGNVTPLATILIDFSHSVSRKVMSECIAFLFTFSTASFSLVFYVVNCSLISESTYTLLNMISVKVQACKLMYIKL